MGVYHSAPIPRECDFDYEPSHRRICLDSGHCSCREDSINEGRGVTIENKYLLDSNAMTFTGMWNTCESLEGFKITGTMDSLGGKAILRNGKGRLVAVVVKKVLGYSILCRDPMYDGQIRDRMIVEDTWLFKWADVWQRHPLSLQLLIRLEDTKSYYVSDNCGPLFGNRMTRIREKESGKIIAFMRQYFKEGIVSDPMWDMMIGPGVCPCLMACFVAIINKSMGKAT